MLNILALYSGLLATLWIVAGVILAGKLYPGYNHATQFCSELGAKGSPTENISPLINNYPLGILFCMFGWYVTQLKGAPASVVISGWLIIIHGISTWVAGYSSMDADAYTKTPSFSHKVHSCAGLILFLSLLVAPVLIIFSASPEYISTAFKLFSIVCVLATLYFTYTFFNAINNKTNLGTHQRLSYGAQLIWLSGYSLVLAEGVN
ncbi:MAG: hypothetical protein COB51_04610 [Moraxellaceae bacterium]|nr:MAG: hypothetical protein COB51_04610 [Moraxellaceae bacterium]